MDYQGENLVEDVLMCIGFVSASQNGNRVPEIAEKHPEILWPRFCDRLEAIGVIGAVRCYQVTCERNGILHVEGSTPRPQNEEELWNLVDPQRFVEYQKEGKSNSMMDHYYDKLLQIAKYDPNIVQNKYLIEEAQTRVQPLLDICIEYGRSGVVPEEKIKSYI